MGAIPRQMIAAGSLVWGIQRVGHCRDAGCMVCIGVACWRVFHGCRLCSISTGPLFVLTSVCACTTAPQQLSCTEHASGSEESSTRHPQQAPEDGTTTRSGLACQWQRHHRVLSLAPECTLGIHICPLIRTATSPVSGASRATWARDASRWRLPSWRCGMRLKYSHGSGCTNRRCVI